MLCKASLMNDEKTFELIVNSETPVDAKRLGRLVENFNQDLWNDNICLIARLCVIEKFRQYSDLLEILHSTGNDSIIAEATTNDKIWGIGINETNAKLKYPTKWKGNNILGYALMYARKYLEEK